MHLARIGQVGALLRVPVAERIVGESNLKIGSPPRLSNTRCVFEKTAITRLGELWQVYRCVSLSASRREAVEFLNNNIREVLYE